MRSKQIAAAALVCCSALLVSGCTKLKARDSLGAGVRDFKSGQFSAAADKFKEACDLDPEWNTPRLYLAMSYMSQWIPGSDSPENKRYAQSAMEQFDKVLAANPTEQDKQIATTSIASIYFNEKDFDKAVEWNKKLIAIKPDSKEAYYTLGVIAWTKWVQEDLKARADMKMKREDPGPLKDKKVKEELKAKWMPVLDEGVQDMNKALQIDPTYDDAMAYMNLLIRYRADLLDTTDEWKKQSEVADDWVNKSMEAKRINQEKKEKAAQGQMKADSEK
jgi:tetratricopeptide (TPR) repeat protein